MNRNIMLAIALFAGCASPMSALRDENRRLSQTVSDMRQERRGQDRRMLDLQHQLDQLRAQVVTSTIEGVPPLPVEVAAPSGGTTPGSRVVAVADDGAEIVYEGDAAAGKVATLEDDPPAPVAPPRRTSTAASASTSALPPVPSVGATDRIEVTKKPTRSARSSPAPTRSASDTPSVRDGDAGNEYRAAVDLVKAGKHDDAVAALRAFIQHYPRHDYADNAQYWIGEAFYARKDYKRALDEFRNVIETFPRGNKVPDALLKVGYCYQALGETNKARAVLEQVVNLYPKSEPAALAAKRLENP